MHTEWAAKHLQVIRTLMERASLYRQALAPVMLRLGGLGLTAGVVGWWNRWEGCRSFIGLWLTAGLGGLCWTYLRLRRQALKDEEPFWSPPTRRVTQALLPPLIVGLVATVIVALPANRATVFAWWLIAAWMVLYGCALHAAGFFMPRGIKLFGALFILAGCALMGLLTFVDPGLPLRSGHVVMGGTFGGFHLAYGLYLRWTETQSDIA
jgi:hypothetical protein